MSVGDARSRIAYLLCDFVVRRALTGLGSLEHSIFPMPQGQIGDATGLTPVHVKPMLAELEKAGVMMRNKRQVEITVWRAMCRMADFQIICFTP